MCTAIVPIFLKGTLILYWILNNSHNIHMMHKILYRPGHPNLDFHSTYAFIKKSTIFTQWLWNSVKIKYSWVLNFDRDS